MLVQVRPSHAGAQAHGLGGGGRRSAPSHTAGAVADVGLAVSPRLGGATAGEQVERGAQRADEDGLSLARARPGIGGREAHRKL